MNFTFIYIFILLFYICVVEHDSIDENDYAFEDEKGNLGVRPCKPMN